MKFSRFLQLEMSQISEGSAVSDNTIVIFSLSTACMIAAGAVA